MGGLITINKLVEMLLQEVRAFDFNKYQNLLLRKAKIREDIKKKRASFSEINNLANEVLPEQRKIVSYYTERLSRLERIIDILSRRKQRVPRLKLHLRIWNILGRGKQRILGREKEEYEYILELLKLLVRLGKSDITSVLEEQETALKEQNTKKYLKLFRKERRIGLQFFRPLSKLGVEVDWKTHRKLSIPMKRVLVVSATLVILYWGFLGGILLQKYSSPEYYGFVPLDACAYQIGATIDKDATVEDWFAIVEKYYQKDLDYETSLETEFEKLAFISVRGEYTKRDLELTKTFFERTYGLNSASNHIPTITYLPLGVELEYMDAKEKKCAAQSFAGIAWQFGIVLTSSENKKPIEYFAIIAHEQAHQIHGFYAKYDTKFNDEWNEIQGGIARRYGTNNTAEDIATVVEAAVVAFLEGKDVMKIKPIDGNYEAFHAKLRFLKQHRFLPPALEIR
jgi:hypothetical protein